jgi:hypothetical protein
MGGVLLDFGIASNSRSDAVIVTHWVRHARAV